MPYVKGSLAKAVEELRRVLAADSTGQEQNWISRVDQSLTAIEQAVKRQRARLSDAQGRVVDVDSPLNPSPTVARRADGLREELDGLLKEADALRGKLQVLHPSTGSMDLSAAGALYVAPEMADISDFGTFCERAEQLLRRFEDYEEEEAELIQESITMDLGAGD